MTIGSVTNDIQVTVSVGKDLSTATIQGVKIEVSSDTNVVVYTNEGVEITPVSGEAAIGTHISTDFNTVVLNGATIKRVADGHFVISAPGIVIIKPGPENSHIEIGAIETTGEHKYEIYGGIWPEEYGGDNNPIWFFAGPKLMDHYEAAAWAERQGGSLPTRRQGDYLTTLRDKGGVFTEIFNRGNSIPAGLAWLAEPSPYNSDCAWSQRLNTGEQRYNSRSLELPVLSIRR